MALLLLAACSTDPGAERARPSSRIPERSTATAEDPIAPIPLTMELDERRTSLGRRLFRDPRLSGDGTRACVDCHELSQGGIVPREARSNHPLNATGPYNVPTIYNVAFNFRFNWNGRFHTLEEHLAGPMMSETVMDAGSWPELVGRLRPHYDGAFIQAGYAEGVTEESIRSVIAEYQRSLTTPNAKLDRFLRGEVELDPIEREGYELFESIGCISCHQGINVGGNLFQRFGVMEDAFGGRELRPLDYGRQLLTGLDEDAHVFRVPSLRNVEVTDPYFHDGSARTLEAAITHMGRVQLGYVLTEGEVAAIAAFLRTLTGEVDGRSLAEAER